MEIPIGMVRSFLGHVLSCFQKQLFSVKTIISSYRSSYSDVVLLLYIRQLFRFSLSPLMQLMLQVSL